MRPPGFQAEAAVYRSVQAYASAPTPYGSAVGWDMAVPARTFGPPPPPVCTTTIACSDPCTLTYTTRCIPGGTTTTAESCCAFGGSCQNGGCVCPTPQKLCSTAAGLHCINVEADVNNCGECGFSCNGGSCSNGQCGNCPPSFGLCGGTCVNLQTEASNCGSCGHQCNPGVGCVAGLCQCPQGQSWTEVQNQCVGALRYYSATLHGPPGTSASIDMCYCTLGPSGTPMASDTPYQCVQEESFGIFPGSVLGIWIFTDPTCCTSQGLSACGSICCPAAQGCCNGVCCPAGGPGVCQCSGALGVDCSPSADNCNPGHVPVCDCGFFSNSCQCVAVSSAPS